jgi:hypothetical protein
MALPDRTERRQSSSWGMGAPETAAARTRRLQRESFIAKD